MADLKKNLNEDDELWDEEDDDAMKDRYLTFRVGDEVYGIEIAYVTEIVGMQKITEVPDMPNFVRGVINLRGQVIPVIDVRARFHMEDRTYDDRTCVVVIQLNETSIGLVVDTVNEVMDIPAGQVSPPPKLGQGEGNRYIKGMGKVGDEVKILLDAGKLLFDNELESIGMANA
ncbi:MAG: chemotaxis protein CheW [Kiritimatiellae bacterium]|nr:chemotaxis protein CheW [Kiritimatiellia bacterium]MDD4735424.1 chemotaxis protein CheW [Kiritimatiellia bacterium]